MAYHYWSQFVSITFEYLFQRQAFLRAWSSVWSLEWASYAEAGGMKNVRVLVEEYFRGKSSRFWPFRRVWTLYNGFSSGTVFFLSQHMIRLIVLYFFAVREWKQQEATPTPVKSLVFSVQTQSLFAEKTGSTCSPLFHYSLNGLNMLKKERSILYKTFKALELKSTEARFSDAAVFSNYLSSLTVLPAFEKVLKDLSRWHMKQNNHYSNFSKSSISNGSCNTLSASYMRLLALFCCQTGSRYEIEIHSLF